MTDVFPKIFWWSGLSLMIWNRLFTVLFFLIFRRVLFVFRHDCFPRVWVFYAFVKSARIFNFVLWFRGVVCVQTTCICQNHFSVRCPNGIVMKWELMFFIFTNAKIRLYVCTIEFIYIWNRIGPSIDPWGTPREVQF